MPFPSQRRRIAAVLSSIGLIACSECGKKDVVVVHDAGRATSVQPSAVALLEQVQGTVRLIRKGVTSAGQNGYLYANDALETDAEASAQVRFPRGQIIELGPDGHFELTERDGGFILLVTKGLVLTRVESGHEKDPPGSRVELTLMTPFGFAKVPSEGADLKMTVDSQRAQVEVTVGVVDWVANDGKAEKVSAGQKAILGMQLIELPPIQMTISAVGRVELKRKEDKRWSAAGRKVVALSEGDSFRVRDGRAVIRSPAGKNTLTFLKGSEVTMGKAAAGENAEEVGFQFTKGELDAETQMKSRLNLNDKVGLSTERPSRFRVRPGKDSVAIDSTTGDIRVDRADTPEATVLGGRTASIPYQGELKSSLVSKEVVALPSRTALKVLQSSSNPVTLTWDGANDQAYDVEVATDAAFKQKILSGVVHQRYVNVVAPARGALYWRVNDLNGKEVTRGSASFGSEQQMGDLDRNNNEVVDGPDMTVIHFQDKPPEVTFLWEASPEANQYRLQLYRKKNLSQPMLDKVTAETRLRVSEGSLGEGDYLWALKYLDAAGTEVGGTGRMNKLFITYDNAVQNLIIKSPKNGDRGGAKVRCVGVAPVGAKLQINGRAVELDEKSRFDTEVAPVGGGMLVFRVLNGGHELYTVRKVTRGK